jgi:hypothetical protein
MEHLYDTRQAWLCAHHCLRLQILNMVVDLLEYLSGSCRTEMTTSCRTEMITTEMIMVEREEEVAVEQIHLLQRFPGFIAGDIAALLHDFPLQAAGDIPGMTMEEAIQVFHVTQHNIVYRMLCNMLYNIYDT